MKDRVSTKILENGAIRYGIYDEAGNLLRYEYIRPEDEPTEPGSAINKANLLPDDVEQMLRLGGMENPQVKDAFISLALGGGKYGFKFDVRYSNGAPGRGIVIDGVTAINGEPCVTNNDGLAIGVSATQTANISIDMTDVIDVAESYFGTIVAGNDLLTEVPIILNLQSVTTLDLTTSSNFKFSSAVESADFCLVGGGGGGARLPDSNYDSGCGGGGGGQAINLMSHIPIGKYSFVCGAGGQGAASSSGNQDGGHGGNSTLSQDDVLLLSANGGGGGYSVSTNPENLNNNIGGSGNGKGGNGRGWGVGWPPNSATPGVSGSISVFNEGVIYPGGGGGGGAPGSLMAGGSSFGGRGGNGYNSTRGESGTGPGGGGGGGANSTSNGYTAARAGGDGYRGQLYIRWRYKTS